MPTNRKLDQTISEWLEADAPRQLPDRVLRSTFERTRRSRQQGGWRVLLGRLNSMNRTFLALGGAAAIVIAAAVALNLSSRPIGVGGGSPVPSTAATAQPTAAAPSVSPTRTPVGLLPEGSQFRLVIPGITVTIPAPDWYGDPGNGILVKNDQSDAPDGAGLIAFGGGELLYVYGNPCDWSTTRPTKPATTVDTFVAAMAAQELRDASEPVNVTVDGYAGKSITVHVPDDAKFSDCDQGYFGSWGVDTESTPARYHQDPGQIDKLWILDVNGELFVIDTAYYAGTPQVVVDELAAIAESATFK